MYRLQFHDVLKILLVLFLIVKMEFIATFKSSHYGCLNINFPKRKM